MRRGGHSASVVLAVSLGLNAVLAAVLVWGGGWVLGGRAGAVSRDLTNRTVRARRPVVASLPPSGPATNEVTEPFQWSQLESEDYRVYVANLRGVGCPERTVRDIITADVNELFRRRVKEMVQPLESRFWEFLADPEKFKGLIEEKEPQLRELDHERDAVLDELLGGDDRRAATQQDYREERELARRRALDFLSPDKLEACLATEQKFSESRQMIADAKPPLTQSEASAAFEKLRQEQDLEMQQVLAPDDWAEYKLRRSRFAQLAQRLDGFDATDEEMESIVRIRAEVGPNPESGSPNGVPSDDATRKEQEQALEQLLGKDRLAQLEQASDARYQEVYQLTDRLELSPGVAAEAFSLRKDAEQAAVEIQSNQNLGAGERAELIAALRQDTEQSLGQVLGETGYKVYRSRFGYWLDQMSANAGR